MNFQVDFLYFVVILQELVEEEIIVFFNLLPNENYIYSFRIELIGLELMRFYSVPEMY